MIFIKTEKNFSSFSKFLKCKSKFIVKMLRKWVSVHLGTITRIYDRFRFQSWCICNKMFTTVSDFSELGRQHGREYNRLSYMKSQQSFAKQIKGINKIPLYSMS